MANKNITIQPVKFRGKIKDCNSLIEEANRIIGRPDVNGVVMPIIFIDDIKEMEYALSEKIQEMQSLMDQVEDKRKFNIKRKLKA